MDKVLIEQRYKECQKVYAEMSSDVDYAINDAERPDEYERVLAIELLEALKQSLDIIDILLCQNDRQD